MRDADPDAGGRRCSIPAGIAILGTALMLALTTPPGVVAAEPLREARRRATTLEAAGDFTGAAAALTNALADASLAPTERGALGFELDRLSRIRRDFRLTRSELVAALRGAIEGFEDAEFDRWEAEGLFDSRRIDGETRYFVSSVSNLFFRRPDLESRRRPRKDTAALQVAYWENASAIRAAARTSGTSYVLPRRLRIRMTLEVLPDSARPGETVSAWLPLPREFPHQDGFEWLGSTPATHRISPANDPVRSAFLEQPAAANGGARFAIEYACTRRGTWFDLDPGRWAPGTNDPALRPFLAEAPHVEFTPAMRRLAAELGGGMTNGVVLARRFHNWISDNIRYSFAPEYSTIRNLGEACRASGRGDCGQTVFLFMTLCRLSGIPARWQSGWALFPGDEAIHDWCEIHIAPWGWVPVDPYMGVYAMQYATALSPSQRQELRDFYFGGLTQFRMAANSDHNQALSPPKRFFRSDDVDFQRGEAETPRGNLYFDRLRYDLKWEDVSGDGAKDTR